MFKAGTAIELSTEAQTAALYRGFGMDFSESHDNPVFCFNRVTGGVDLFTSDDLRAQTWWMHLPEKHSLSIEAWLFPLERVNPGVSFVALHDAAYTLISGSRLSDYFEGEHSAAAFDCCKRLRDEHPNAGVFSSDSVEHADRILAAAIPVEESGKLLREKMLAARAARMATRRDLS